MTNTATSIAKNTTTALPRSWPCSILNPVPPAISLVFVPLFVWLTRRVGKPTGRCGGTDPVSIAAYNAIELSTSTARL